MKALILAAVLIALQPRVPQPSDDIPENVQLGCYNVALIAGYITNYRWSFLQLQKDPKTLKEFENWYISEAHTNLTPDVYKIAVWVFRNDLTDPYEALNMYYDKCVRQSLEHEDILDFDKPAPNVIVLYFSAM